jgi:hypothetical protein
MPRHVGETGGTSRGPAGFVSCRHDAVQNSGEEPMVISSNFELAPRRIARVMTGTVSTGIAQAVADVNSPAEILSPPIDPGNRRGAAGAPQTIVIRPSRPLADGGHRGKTAAN